MTTRADKFLSGLDARYRYKSALDRIDRDISDEQQRFQVAQSYAEQARTELNALDAKLSEVQDQQGLASELIKMVDRDNIAAARSVAQAGGRARAERAIPTEVAAFIGDARKDRAKTRRAVAKATEYLGRPGGLTAEQASAVLAEVGTLSLSSQDRARLDKAAASQQRRGAVSGAARLSPDQQRDLALTRRASEILEFGGPAGIAGGFDGEAEVDRRRGAMLPAGSLFATEDDAYKAYLTMLDDGRATPEEVLVRFPSATPEEVSQALSVARETYNRAKAAKAFRNDERKFFSERYLDQARKVAEMEARVEGLTPQYTDPARERLRRQLLSRGIDPDDPYLAYRGTPMYDYVKSADRIHGEVKGEELRPATKDQLAVVRLLDQYEATGTEWTATDLEAQIGKRLKGKELVDAIGFALALDKQRTEGLDAPTQLELQTEKSRKDAEFKREQERFLSRETEMLDQLRADKERVAREATLEDVRRNEQEQNAKNARAIYTRARAGGASAEEARALMMEAFAEAPRTAVVEKVLEPFGGSETLRGVAEESRAAAPGTEAAARIGIGAERGRVHDDEFAGEPKLLGEPEAAPVAAPVAPVAPPAPAAPAPAPARARRAPAPPPGQPRTAAAAADLAEQQRQAREAFPPRAPAPSMSFPETTFEVGPEAAPAPVVAPRVRRVVRDADGNLTFAE